MSENIIVGLIVAAAAAFVVYRFFGGKNRGKCGCGCSGCEQGKPGQREIGAMPGDDGQASDCSACADRAKNPVNINGSIK